MKTSDNRSSFNNSTARAHHYNVSNQIQCDQDSAAVTAVWKDCQSPVNRYD